MDQIVRGEKRYEIRVGERYRNVAPGHVLTLQSGRLNLKARCRDVEVHDAAHTLPIDVTDCYGDAQGPFYLFRFDLLDKVQKLPEAPSLFV